MQSLHKLAETPQGARSASANGLNIGENLFEAPAENRLTENRWKSAPRVSIKTPRRRES
jgi:hypothetical protein